jgi:hypothetical protein
LANTNLVGEDDYVDVSFTFSSPFSAAPAVSAGNIVTEGTATAYRLRPIIRNVTTTGCTVRFLNSFTGSTFAGGTWKLIIAGAE